MDLFGSLFPVDGQILKKRDLVKVVKELYGQAGRISEITYTWEKGRAAMEVLAGRYDDYHELEVPEESPLQMVYNESEYYNYILYLPEGYDPEDTEKKWPVIYFFHGYGKQGDDLSVLLPEGPTRYINKGGKLSLASRDKRITSLLRDIRKLRHRGNYVRTLLLEQLLDLLVRLAGLFCPVRIVGDVHVRKQRRRETLVSAVSMLFKICLVEIHEHKTVVHLYHTVLIAAVYAKLVAFGL